MRPVGMLMPASAPARYTPDDVHRRGEAGERSSPFSVARPATKTRDRGDPVHLRHVIIATVILLLATACAHGPPHDPQLGREGLRPRQDAFLAALAARDLEQTVAHFAEDAVLHVANMPPVQGREAIRQFYGNVFRFLSASEPVAERSHVAESGDLAYSVGSVTNVFRGEQGPVEYVGKFLLIWERRADEWAIAVYSISNNRPDASR
jgi:ketosteroid isomerase-like protein